MRLLPNFTAYWYMLPRRMKRIRTYRDAMIYQATVTTARFLAREWERSFRIAVAMNSERLELISNRSFRVPFQLVAQ